MKKLEWSINYNGGARESELAKGGGVKCLELQMKLKLLSWNVRGAKDNTKRKVIKALIWAQRVDLVCLQETKIQEISIGVVRTPWCGEIFGVWGSKCEGAGDGVVVFLDNIVLELVGMEVGQFSSPVVLKIVRMVLVGSLQGFMALL